MPSARTRPLLERLWMACVALLFLLQPIALAGAGCSLRAELSGGSCCCAKAEKPAQKPSCCAKRAGHDAPAQKPAPKKCGCEVSAPPLLPPGPAAELPQFLGELARLCELPVLPLVACELLPAAPRAQAPPGRAGCFHACLGASLARALAFERTLRC